MNDNGSFNKKKKKQKKNLMFQGIDIKTGTIVEFPRPGVKYISGSPWLDNHSVNLIGCFLTALFIPSLAQLIWY